MSNKQSLGMIQVKWYMWKVREMDAGPVTKIEPKIAARLAKQRYHLVGDHGGVKVCHWTKQSLIADRSCYKGTFYGIESHGCMQMAPNVDTCNLGCTYCWREPHSDTLNKIDDDPYELYLQSVKAHRRLLTGYGGNPKADREKWLEAQNPKHVAISLNGEPTLYSRLGEFLEVCHQHGTSTFLVTNGSLPKVIENLDPLPTQLYVSVDAPNKEIFDRIGSASPSSIRRPSTNWRRHWEFFHRWIQGLFVDIH